MEEENKDEKEDETKEETIEEIKKDMITELDRADDIADRQKRENDRREELLTREENLEARRAVGGETDAGQTQKPKEQTPQEYAADVVAGKYNDTSKN